MNKTYTPNYNFSLYAKKPQQMLGLFCFCMVLQNCPYNFKRNFVTNSND